jgi:hypothetical protein
MGLRAGDGRQGRKMMRCPVRVAVLMAVLLLGVGPTHADRRPTVDAATHYLQRQLVDRVLAQLWPTSGDHAQLYFVGFAGYGGQDVFKREVVAVRELFDERFGTAGKSIALINSRSASDDVPLANESNLDRVLQHLGTLMNPSRDSLFLFLTSHGENGRLAVEIPGVGFDQLTPGHLRGMLDRSGIKNSTVVISACHSGSFIPVLANPTTLVIAAARADRSSFGCEDRRRWTYFGDAYFNHALRQETSFTEAFQKAKQLIAIWEAQARLMPSLPQMAGGGALRSSLVDAKVTK